MEFLAEFLMELVGEALIGAGVDAASNRRCPKWLRVSILSLIVLFFAAVFVLVGAGGIVMVAEDNPAIGFAMLALDLALIVFSLCKLCNILRTFPRK